MLTRVLAAAPCVVLGAVLLTACTPERSARAPVLVFAEPPTAAVERLAERARAGYVRIRVLDPAAVDSDGRRAWQTTVNEGSGTVIDPFGHVITAAHLIPRRDLEVEIETGDGHWRSAEILDLAMERELALLRVASSEGLRLVPPALSPHVRVDEPVIAIGAPTGRSAVVVIVGRVLDHGRAKPVHYGAYRYDRPLILAIDAAPGFSGGPVFGLDGRLVGMLASFAVGEIAQVPYVAPRLGYAVPADAIAAYLADVLGPVEER